MGKLLAYRFELDLFTNSILQKLDLAVQNKWDLWCTNNQNLFSITASSINLKFSKYSNVAISIIR